MHNPQEVLEELLDHLDLRFEWYMDRPRMYSFDAFALEVLFDTVERLRERVLKGAKAGEPVTLDGYNRYLQERYPHIGGQSVVSHTCKSLGARADDERVYQTLIDFWREYLASPYRMQRNERPDERRK